MTREEAKEILTHNWTRVDNPNYSESELDEAFFMAIEALSAEEMMVIQTGQTYGKSAYIKELAEVVRCKDCRHRDLFSCPLADNDFQKDDDFCSWGERKEP